MKLTVLGALMGAVLLAFAAPAGAATVTGTSIINSGGSIAAGDPALKSFLEGVELTERELLNVLERHGVTRIDPLGQRFDPNCHQAMYEVPDPSVPEGTVVDVMQSGYTIGDRCLRPALVAVAKGGAKQAKPKGNGNGTAPRRPANDDIPGGQGIDQEPAD